MPARPDDSGRVPLVDGESDESALAARVESAPIGASADELREAFGALASLLLDSRTARGDDSNPGRPPPPFGATSCPDARRRPGRSAPPVGDAA